MSPRADGMLLDIQGLHVALYGSAEQTAVVRDARFRVDAGGTLGVVGESGCGKTMSMLALGGLLPAYGEATARSVRWKGRDIGLAGLQALRGSGIGFVFQDPMTALNPLMRVGEQIAECLRKEGASRRQASAGALGLLTEVGIAEPRRCARQYPWELSGGMAQRVLIAIALAPQPDLLIADEPTTAIDASARRHVLALIGDLQRSRGLGVLLVSHDLAVVRSQADEIAVMYAGKVVEYGDAREVTAAPRHPYTQALVGCTLDPFDKSTLASIAGEPPRPSEVGRDCAFRERCAFAIAACSADPDLAAHGRDDSAPLVACWHPREAVG